MHGMKSTSEMLGNSNKVDKMSPRDEGNVSELLLDNKRV